LRQRFLKSGRSALADYELLELLLSYAIPRKDTKPIAKNLISAFGDFASVFDQPAKKLQEISGIGLSTASFLQAIKSTLIRYLERQAEEAETISSPEDVVAYVRLAIGAVMLECS